LEGKGNARLDGGGWLGLGVDLSPRGGFWCFHFWHGLWWLGRGRWLGHCSLQGRLYRLDHGRLLRYLGHRRLLEARRLGFLNHGWGRGHLRHRRLGGCLGHGRWFRCLHLR
jgi:hypothetical protein